MTTFVIPLAIVFIGANLFAWCLARAADIGDRHGSPPPYDWERDA